MLPFVDGLCYIVFIRRSKRVSKVKTLQGAMDYITHLQALLQEPPDLCDGDFPNMCTPVPYSVYAPSVRIQLFRDTANSMRDPTSVPDNEDMTCARHQPLGSTNHSYGGTCWGDTEVRTISHCLLITKNKLSKLIIRSNDASPIIQLRLLYHRMNKSCDLGGTNCLN